MRTFSTTAKLVIGGVGLLLIILVLVWGYNLITAKPKAEAKLRGNQVEAAQQSGQDTSNTVAAAGKRESETSDLTRTNSEEILNAEGADAPVAAPVRDAGLASLCRRASYRNDPKCVQSANSK